jgi:hypothetical protein
VVEEFEDGEEDLGFDDDGDMLLRSFLQVGEDVVDFLLGLVEFHRLRGIFHAEVDILVVESAQLLLPLGEALEGYRYLLLLHL